MPKHVQGSIDLEHALDAYSCQARSVTSRVATHPAIYTAAASAALALAPSADAAVQYSGRQDLPLSLATGVGTVSVDISINQYGTTQAPLDGIGDFRFYLGSSTTGYWRWASFGPFGAGFLGQGAVAYLGNPARLNAGATISNTALGQNRLLSNSIGGGSRWGNWDGGTMSFDAAHFLGVGFKIPAGSDTNLHYAWIRVGISNNSSGQPIAMTIYDWAWEDDPNTGVIAGSLSSIPEPSPTSGLALLAAGAAGVTAWRRRKQTKS